MTRQRPKGKRRIVKRIAALALLQLSLAAGGAQADLTNPSTLTIIETSPSRFSVELTLPVISGRVARARPILPDVCTIDGDPEVRGDSFKAIRTWSMSCNTERLVGAPVGVQGLLGTTLDVLLTVEMLDGRQYVRQLRPTQAFFVIPPRPTIVELGWSAGRSGAERLLQQPEMALLILAVFLAGARWRTLLIALAAFAVAHGFGQWLGGQRWIVMSIFLAQVAAAGTAWLLAAELLGRPVLEPGWQRPLWVPMLLLGTLFGSARPETVEAMGLSSTEQSLSLGLFAVGTLLGLLLLAVWAELLRKALAGLGEEAGERWTRRVASLIAVLAGGLLIYRLTAPFWAGSVAPLVPLVTLITTVALALWCRRDFAAESGVGDLVPAAIVAVCWTLGVAVSFSGALPFTDEAVFGLLALVGARLLSVRPWPFWLGLSTLAATALYHGYHAARMLGQETTLPVANAVGAGLLLTGLYLLAYRALPADDPGGRSPLKLAGVLTVAVALLWQLAEYRDWANGPVAADLAMGFARLPMLAAILLAAAWLVWPRRRRFAPSPERGATGAHWVLLALAFFVLPRGAVRVDIPFHSPGAPSAAEARRVMDGLLTDTYLAFNLTDEDAAFDRLAQNLSQELVADVYLDSRRRLTAGTREGAEVTVRNVSVMEVDDAIRTDGNAFTYPCQWVVTARVRHLQHIHNRQNVYAGELTITVEDDRWKIAGLELSSEERVVLSWTRS